MKSKYDTSSLFPDGSPKSEEETPLLNILNQISGSIFKLHEGFAENKKQLITLIEKFEELSRLVRTMEATARHDEGKPDKE